jgi:molecular chaperone HscA
MQPINITEENPDEIVIGIDLGTTNSLVAYQVNDHDIAIVPMDEDGSVLMPSVFKNIRSIKRLMGKSKDELSDILHLYPINHSYDHIVLDVAGKNYSPIEISAKILLQLKENAQAILEQEIRKAVITVPAYFDDNQRNATKQAAAIAGIDVIRLINEPTAAALAYGIDQKSQGIYLVYDLGGGTFDISILKMHDSVFQVLATCGDNALGGDDCDIKLAKFLSEKYQVAYNNELVLIAKKMKEGLSSNDNVVYQDFQLSIEEFNNIIQELIAKTISLCDEAVNLAKITKQEIKGIILVGGSTRLGLVKKELKNTFSCPILDNLNPDEIVAVGAARQAYNLTVKNNALLIDVIPLSLGIETVGGLVEKIITRNSAIPASEVREFTTYADGQTGMIFNVVQGEREMVANNIQLATFELKGIPPMKAGVARVKVVFSVDVDGILNVFASEQITGVSQSVTIKPALKFEQIEEALMDSFANAQNDHEKRLLIEVKVEAQSLLQSVNNALIEDGSLLGKQELSDIEVKLLLLQNAISKDDKEEIKLLQQDLESSIKILADKQISQAVNKHLSGKNVNNILPNHS